jgi:putative aldouronate transport system permease protein
MLVLRMGSMMNVGFEKIILLYNNLTMETADVISSYVYRRGMLEAHYSFGTAVGLFNPLINFVFLWFANWVSRRLSENSLW